MGFAPVSRQHLNFTTVSRDRHARFYETVTPSIAIILQLRAVDMYDLTKGLRPAPQDCNFTTVSRDRHVRSYEMVALSTTRSQFYYSFARSTRTILRKGCAQHGKIAILLQFRAIDTYDLTKGLHSAQQDRNFTTVSRDRHVRSYETFTPSTARSSFYSFYYSFARSTRMILRKGCAQRRKIAILARSTRTILRKGCISASIFRTMAPPLVLKKSIK